MLRSAVRKAFAGALIRPLKILATPPPSHAAAAAARTVRFYGAGASAGATSVVSQMIQYALSHARTLKSEESFAQAILVLEQGLSNSRDRGGDSAEDEVSMFMLAMSTLLYERGAIEDAVDKLKMVHSLEQAALPLRVAAWEGLVGLNLEAGQDATSSTLADECLRLLESRKEDEAPVDKVLSFRANAIKGITDVVLGRLDSAKLAFASKEIDVEDCGDSVGSALLSRGEYHHITGNFSSAKNFYDRVLRLSDTESPCGSCLAAANMVSEEVLLGATCALGQLLSHSGNFDEAEEMLTKALKLAEIRFGPTHPKVGVVLTSIALMFKRKTQIKASSSILIQEGLYRKALDLLKAPCLEEVDNNPRVYGSDIIALARGGYSEVLCVQQNRKEEGARMREWAEMAWGTRRRLSLAEALELSEPTKVVVLDARVKRAL